MHFPIIRLEPQGTEPKDFAKELPYDDACLLDNTDYYGELDSSEDRKRIINSPWLKDLLEGIATIDTEKETITFLDSDTILHTQQEYLIEFTEELHKKALKHTLHDYELRHASCGYKDYDTLFFLNYGMTTFEFIMNASYHAGKTYMIGNTFDAHI